MQFATGAMSTLLPKLGKLLHDEYKLKDRVKQGIKGLKAELESMEAALVKVSNVPLDQLDPQLKIWANAVRDLSYVIEDSLDSSMVRIEGLEPTKIHTFKGFFEATRKKMTRLKARHKIANDIENIERQVKKVKERYDRYKIIDDAVANFATITIDPRLPALYNEVSNLVGIDKEIDELVKRLSKAHDLSEKKLNTISVVGFGGLGKTTLVKAVYDNLNKKFDCGCFVPVGQNPDKKKVLRDILYELDKEKYINIIGSKMDEKQLIDETGRFLVDKRYLIVIDDIWDTSIWKIVKCALLGSNPRSRIIVTTRSHEVAEQVGGVYNMKQLSDANSKKLLDRRIYGGEGISMDIQCTEVMNKILKKCAGVPLSIITIASLIVGKRMEDWPKVYDAIGFGNDDNEAVQNTRKIISYSYYDLPSCLKTCLLYMSIFLEDSFVEKDMLIWKWVAEGFITDKEEIGLFEQGENYFNNLVNRSMIRWVEPDSRSSRGGCVLHDMVLDFIFNLSGKLNFATILDKKQEIASSSCKNNNQVRRLAIHTRCAEQYAASIELGHLRSFSATLCSDGRMPPLRILKSLRVLALHSCDSAARDWCLDHLGKLLHLRYLGLVLTPFTELPRDIGHDLKFLQTLDVRRSGIKELPVSVSELRKLACLRASQGTKMMASIGNLTSLQELQLHHVDVSPNFARELRNLKQLRVLAICFDEMDESTHKALVESICSLRRIETLRISCISNNSRELQVDDWEQWVPRSGFHTLWLDIIYLPRYPRWMNLSSIPDISFLVFNVKLMKAQDMQILGRFPSLHYLFVNINNHLLYTVGPDEFRKLRYLYTNIEIICGGEGGALMMLQELKCLASVEKQQGVGSLVPGSMPLLQKATFDLYCEGCSAVQVEEAETSLRQAAEAHPNCPTIEINKYNFKSDDDKDDQTMEVSSAGHVQEFNSDIKEDDNNKDDESMKESSSDKEKEMVSNDDDEDGDSKKLVFDGDDGDGDSKQIVSDDDNEDGDSDSDDSDDGGPDNRKRRRL
ncbi:hypothetical protein ACQ4PT_068483 [Festuca glaucescens]